MDTNDLVRQYLSSEGGAKQKTAMINAINKGEDNTIGRQRSLYKFSTEDNSVVKTYLDADSGENSIIMKGIIDAADSIMKNVPKYKVVISTFINGNPMGFYDLMNSYKRSYSKVVLDYLTQSVELKITDEKVEYTLGTKHISYKREEFMKMLDTLSKTDASVVKEKINQAKVRSSEYVGMYG
jgi:hypothetical protein